MLETKRLFPLLLAVLLLAPAALAGPLHDYVYTTDPNYAYTLHSTIEGEAHTAYVLDMVSQSWREDVAAPSVWRHWLTVIQPHEVKSDTALLFISGGRHTDPAPEAAPAELVRIALVTGCPVAYLRGVPNQPLVFAGDGKDRVEDEIIAYTFSQYVDTGDPTWPLLCAMVKSAVRAMDTVQDFCIKRLTPPMRVSEFVVAGISKRGWTTWLTGATDPRVVGIAPMVIDVLNMSEQMEHQQEMLGRYSEEVSDYEELNLMDMLATDEGKALRRIVDPYSYIDDLTMPKLVMLGAGDEYWAVDAARLYFPKLEEPKWIRYEPNADHGMFGKQGPQEALCAFFGHMAAGKSLPDIDWKIKENGKFKIECEEEPVVVRVWQAVSDSLDFRRVTIGDVWKSQVIPPHKEGVYKGRILEPEEGNVAFFFELVYPSGLGFNYSLSTIMTVRK